MKIDIQLLIHLDHSLFIMSFRNVNVGSGECCYEGCKQEVYHYGYYNFMWRKACEKHAILCGADCCTGKSSMAKKRKKQLLEELKKLPQSLDHEKSFEK